MCSHKNTRIATISFLIAEKLEHRNTFLLNLSKISQLINDQFQFSCLGCIRYTPSTNVCLILILCVREHVYACISACVCFSELTQV